MMTEKVRFQVRGSPQGGFAVLDTKRMANVAYRNDYLQAVAYCEQRNREAAVTRSEAKAIRLRYCLTRPEMAALMRMKSARAIANWEEGSVAVPGPASIVLELLDEGVLPNRYFG